MIVITTPSWPASATRSSRTCSTAAEELRVIARDPQALHGRRAATALTSSRAHTAMPQSSTRHSRGAECRLLAGAAGPTSSFGRSRLRRLHPARRRGVHEATTSRRVVGVSALGRGTPWADQRRLRHRLSGDGRPDRQSSGVALPGAHQPLLHGQHRPPGRGDQEPGHVLLADRRGPQAAERRHPRHRCHGLAASARRAAGAASKRSRCSAPKTCPSTTWPEIISEVLGKEVRFQQTTFEAYKDQVRRASGCPRRWRRA